MARYAPVLAAVSAVWASPSSLLAADLPCPPVPAEIDRLVSARWPDLPRRISGALDGRPEVDGCARLAIRLDPRTVGSTAILLEVVLRDGRAASRSVARAEDVIPTLEALLLLPEADGRATDAEPVAATAEPVRVTAPASGRASVTVELAAVPLAPLRQPGRLGIEFSVLAGARVGDGQTGVGVGALTFFDVRGWLLGFEGAADDYQGRDGGPASSVLELAVLVGRRFRLGSVALDLTAGPAVAMNGFGRKVAVMAGTGASAGAAPSESGGLHRRLVCGARLSFRMGAVVRPFVGLEGQLALESSPVTVSPVEARLPAWTAGLVVGATLGTP